MRLANDDLGTSSNGHDTLKQSLKKGLEINHLRRVPNPRSAVPARSPNSGSTKTTASSLSVKTVSEHVPGRSDERTDGRTDLPPVLSLHPHLNTLQHHDLQDSRSRSDRRPQSSRNGGQPADSSHERGDHDGWTVKHGDLRGAGSSAPPRPSPDGSRSTNQCRTEAILIMRDLQMPFATLATITMTDLHVAGRPTRVLPRQTPRLPPRRSL